MCLIIANMDSKIVDISLIKKAISANPHGVGILYETGKNVYVTRLVGSVPALQKRVSNIYDEVLKHVPFILHTRSATRGIIGKKNVHPFRVDDRYFMFHNGTFDIDIRGGSSDSKVMGEEYFSEFSKMGVDLLGSSFVKIVETFDTKNKFILYDLERRRFQIFNERLGTWRDGVWYSKNPNIFDDTRIPVIYQPSIGFRGKTVNREHEIDENLHNYEEWM